ncbi:hypothetical protein E2C01_072503 [Portunus trituberculatus]|uniref:Uncharacterized protein n=1 Tax=Portunus trituberculatus TaxID=210409 RepID=A0A5B7I017_PORTR|nr:hypothetical protein [Portunus trituberculatus]
MESLEFKQKLLYPGIAPSIHCHTCKPAPKHTSTATDPSSSFLSTSPSSSSSSSSSLPSSSLRPRSIPHTLRFSSSQSG